MKLKLTPFYIISFLFLVFFVHELHDWAHTLTAAIIGGCWGPRAFDSWEFCSPVSSGQRILATIAGPLVNIILMWVGWQKMDNRNSMQEQSLGCTLVFVTLPFAYLLAAARGGGDITWCIRLLFPKTDVSNHHVVTLAGLLTLVIISLPPLVRAFYLLPWRQAKLFFFPVALVLPGFLDHWLVGGLLNRVFINAETPRSQAYTIVISWTLLVFAGWLLTRRSLKNLFSDAELPL